MEVVRCRSQVEAFSSQPFSSGRSSAARQTAQEFAPEPFSQVETIQAPEPETTTESTTTTTTPLVVIPEVEDVPDIAITVESENGALSNTVIIIILLTVGSVAPSILLLMTSFTRFIIVLGLTRNAIGVQTIPPSQVLIGLAVFLTIFVMGPVFSEVNEVAIQPMLGGEIGQAEAMVGGLRAVPRVHAGANQ